jgi:hypothetical protein
MFLSLQARHVTVNNHHVPMVYWKPKRRRRKPPTLSFLYVNHITYRYCLIKEKINKWFTANWRIPTRSRIIDINYIRLINSIWLVTIVIHVHNKFRDKNTRRKSSISVILYLERKKIMQFYSPILWYRGFYGSCIHVPFNQFGPHIFN